MNDDTTMNVAMSDDNEDVRDGETMKKELSREGIEIENPESQPEDEVTPEEDEEEEGEEAASDDSME